MKYRIIRFLKLTIKVMRVDDPRPALFLFLPSCWGFVLANGLLHPAINIYIGLFFLGSLFTYITACVINDIIDRDIDARIPRTAERPIAKGEYSIFIAACIAILFGYFSLKILFILPKSAFAIGLIGGILIIAYPFAKRLMKRPQIFLGITANIGMLMAYALINNSLSIGVLWMYIGSIYWSCIYDSIYSNQDKEYDTKIGTGSMSVYYGDKIQGKLKSWSVIMFIDMAIAGFAERQKMGIMYYVFLLLTFGLMSKTVNEIDLSKKESSYEGFVNNIWIGFLILLSCYLGRI